MGNDPEKSGQFFKPSGKWEMIRKNPDGFETDGKWEVIWKNQTEQTPKCYPATQVFSPLELAKIALKAKKGNRWTIMAKTAKKAQIGPKGSKQSKMVMQTKNG